MATSRKTQQVVLKTWKTTRAYPSEGIIQCAAYGCGRIIPEGEFYTIRKPEAAWWKKSRHAFCRECIPFVVCANDEVPTYADLLDQFEETEAGQKDRAMYEASGDTTPQFGNMVIVLDGDERGIYKVR